jgi:hypothetical protein
MRCSRCGYDIYCGTACQRMAWKAGHKLSCTAITEAVLPLNAVIVKMSLGQVLALLCSPAVLSRDVAWHGMKTLHNLLKRMGAYEEPDSEETGESLPVDQRIRAVRACIRVMEHHVAALHVTKIATFTLNCLADDEIVAIEIYEEGGLPVVLIELASAVTALKALRESSGAAISTCFPENLSVCGASVEAIAGSTAMNDPTASPGPSLPTRAGIITLVDNICGVLIRLTGCAPGPSLHSQLSGHNGYRLVLDALVESEGDDHCRENVCDAITELVDICDEISRRAFVDAGGIAALLKCFKCGREISDNALDDYVTLLRSLCPIDIAAEKLCTVTATTLLSELPSLVELYYAALARACRPSIPDSERDVLDSVLRLLVILQFYTQATPSPGDAQIEVRRLLNEDKGRAIPCMVHALRTTTLRNDLLLAMVVARELYELCAGDSDFASFAIEAGAVPALLAALRKFGDEDSKVAGIICRSLGGVFVCTATGMSHIPELLAGGSTARLLRRLRDKWRPKDPDAAVEIAALFDVVEHISKLSCDS